MKTTVKRPSDSLDIECEVGVNNLYVPSKFEGRDEATDSYGCALRVSKTDKKTITKVVNKFKEVAQWAIDTDHTEKTRAQLMAEASEKKFVDGDKEKYERYESEHGKRILNTICYNDRPATGRLVNGKIVPERLGEGEGKKRGYIQRGDKVRAVLNVYHTKTKQYDHIMVKLVALVLLEKGDESPVSTDFESRLARASKVMGVKVSEDGEEGSDEFPIQEEGSAFEATPEEKAEKKLKRVVKKEKKNEEVDEDSLFD